MFWIDTLKKVKYEIELKKKIKSEENLTKEN